MKLPEKMAFTIPDLMRRNVASHPEKVLLASDRGHLTYAEANARSRSMARGLIAAGVRKGSHVALLHPAGEDFLVAMLAVTRIGAVAIPLSTMATPEELRTLLANSDASFLIAASTFRSHDYSKTLRSALPDLDPALPPPLQSGHAPWLRRVWFSHLPEGWHPDWSYDALQTIAEPIDESILDGAEATVRPADRFVMLHSSGSTGHPKGVVHQQGTMLEHLARTNVVRRYGTDDIFFTTFAWFWNAGFSFGLVGTLVAGARIAVTNETEPANILDFIERERPTITNGFWRTAVRWAEDPSFANRNFSFLRRGNLFAILSEEVRPADPSLRHDIYGMSETAGAVALFPDEGDLPETMRGSCGKILPWFEARIVDACTLEDCEPGHSGELWLRGPLMAECYWGKPRSAIYTPDGWYRTGDIGTFDSEGFFYLKGRTGDMIKTSSVDVAPREVEAVLASLTDNLPNVVFGVPDAERGQAVMAVVVTDRSVDEALLRKALASRLSPYKVPRRVLSIQPERMPLLATGKFDVEKLAAMVDLL